MASTKQINPERLKQLRSKVKLSQKELEGKISVGTGTVSRWESGKARRLRQSNRGKLCEALNTTEAELCGEGPLPEQSRSRSESPRDQLNLVISTACRNAMALVAKRYGVTRQQIVEIAPLLLYIIAEESLQRRKQAIRVACPPHLPRESFDVDDDPRDAEQRSIEERDLFADIVTRETGHEIAETDTPLAQYLTERLEPFSRFKKEASKARSVEWDGTTPTYFICPDEALNLVGGDKKAAKLILTGAVGLHEMPGEIRRSSSSERAQWVLDKYKKLPDGAASGDGTPDNVSLDEIFRDFERILSEDSAERERLNDPAQLQDGV